MNGEKLRAIMVCVDYADILAVTLPYNRHHFEAVYIITSNRCQAETEAAAFRPLLRDQRCGVIVLTTDLFYQDGATFNKWRALEWGLDQMGRHGWLCLMDADVLWPKLIQPFPLEVGKLYSPLRRMWENPSPLLPLEKDWRKFPIHRNVNEWAGYTQIFHADDPVLGPPPWHETDWIHAGGADSFFQAKWPRADRVRPPFEVLHLGSAGVNWMGRSSMRTDGSIPEGAAERIRAYEALWPKRRRAKAAGRDEFEGERLG